MTQAEYLVRQITEDLKDVEQAIRANPYPQAFRNGDAGIDALVPFIGHQYHMHNADPVAAAPVFERLDPGLSGTFIRGFVQGAHASRARIPIMAKQIGWSEADLRAYEPSAEGFAYCTYLSLLLHASTAAEVLCGLLVNLPAWNANCGDIGQGLRDNYGWPVEATAFVDSYAEMPAFDKEALPVIQAGLDQGEDPNNIARVARLIQSYEKMFWDAVAAEAGLALSDNQSALRLSA